MISGAVERSVSSTSECVTQFRISEADSAHVMAVLRDAIYSDKVRAVLREYGANAVDAHADPAAAPGRRDEPILVRLPTLSEPSLEIRDFGPGLSPDAVARVFTQYGASTKRDHADSVGYIGIGCKSGFAYTDQFSVTSRHAGTCSVYAAVLDSTDMGEIHLLHQTECDPDDTGLTVQVPVRAADVHEFRSKAREVFAYYSPRPNLVGGAEWGPVAPVDVVTVGAESGWVAVMGCVSYPIDVAQLDVPAHVRGSSGVVRFPLGSLSVSASREALRYDERTRERAAAGLCSVLDAHVHSLLAASVSMTEWQQRVHLAGMEVFASLIKSFRGVFSTTVDVPSVPTSSTVPGVKALRGVPGQVHVRADAHFVFADDRRAIAGFKLDRGAMVVRPGNGVPVNEAWDALVSVISRCHMVGIRVVRTSEMEWTRPKSKRAKGGGGAVAHPRKCAAFRYLWSKSDARPNSAMWEAVVREPADDDLYVIIDKFKPPGEFCWAERSAREVMSHFGADHPNVYGYRRGQEPPRGRPYMEWVTGLIDVIAASDPKLAKIREALAWRNRTVSQGVAAEFKSALGAGHPVARVAIAAAAGRALLDGLGSGTLGAVDKLRWLTRGEFVPDVTAFDRYPLLAAAGTPVLCCNNPSDWTEYVRAVDALRESERRRESERLMALTVSRIPNEQE